jgi:16S rRNA (guanine527-N7)-methyltransferase
MVGKRRIESADIVTARALAPMDRLLEWARPHFGKGTRGLFLKGRDVEREVGAARRRWRFDLEFVPSRTDRDGRIALVHTIAPVKEG